LSPQVKPAAGNAPCTANKFSGFVNGLVHS
jgi:hypothetical protein